MEVKIKPKIVISAVINRADGTIEDLGVISEINIDEKKLEGVKENV